MSVQILTGDCRDLLRALPDQSVHCCVTSPPYFGLRDYGTAKWEGGAAECDHRQGRPGSGRADGVVDDRAQRNRDGVGSMGGNCKRCGARRVDSQIGLEPTPDAFVAEMVAVFREVKRVLRNDGVVFLNLGDSYCSASAEQVFCLREDCSLEVAKNVALEVFGLWIDGDEASSQRSLPEVLSDNGEGSPLCHRSDMASEGKQAVLQPESGCDHSQDNESEQADKGKSDGGPGRQVRVLRGGVATVLDGGSHPRGRSSTQEGTHWQEPGIVNSDLQGHPPTRLSARAIPNPLLELQLRDRIVRLLSSRHVTAEAIPSSLRQHFRPVGIKPKDLIGIPWAVAFALRADGWYLRQDIIWSKPNPMPESVTDRCTKAHEYLFMLSKSPRYFYDAAAIADPLAYGSIGRLSQNVDGQEGSSRVPGKTNGKMKAVYKESYNGKSTKDYAAGGAQDPSATKARIVDRILAGDLVTRNKRSVWTVTTKPFKGAHFATFPPDLIEPCIKAGCPKGGTVLDPFGGAGTTGLVADRLGRNAVLMELNPAYAEMARRRIEGDAGMFAAVQTEAAQ